MSLTGNSASAASSMKKEKNILPELLSPAGSFESLAAAVNMGADAVYLSGKNFGARSYADNFDNGQLENAVRYAHLRGVKVHITVNTLIGDKEFAELEEYLKFLNSLHVDALIIQDLGVLSLAKNLGLCMQFHASTQLTVHNLSGALAAKELGFDRVVLSRELSFKEIKYISENCGIETEMFIHGAMCMSYSGQCLMSSALGGRSGNRGRCAQPCRQLYKSGENKEKYFLSLKDMALIERLDDIKESGVTSLKIEVRMKGPSYVGCVTKIYKKCLEEGRQPSKSEINDLNRIFFRGGLSSGYFDNKKGRAMFAFNKPDNPYKKETSSLETKILDEIKDREDKFKIHLTAKVNIAVGEKIKLIVLYKNKTITVRSNNTVEAASSNPTEKERVIQQISKTGGSVFIFDSISVEVTGRAYVPIKDLNYIRREALKMIEDEILSDSIDIQNRNESISLNHSAGCDSSLSGMTASIFSYEQFTAVKEFEESTGKIFRLIYVPVRLLGEDYKRFISDKDRIVIEPPSIIHDSEYEKYIDFIMRLFNLGFNKIRVHNISEYRRIFDGFKIFGSYRMNITNSNSVKLCSVIMGFSSVMLSPELSIPQIRDIAKGSDIPTEVCVYGYQPLMLTENCILKNLDSNSCKCNSIGCITDRLGKKFPVIKDGTNCRSVLLNSCPTFMADKMEELKCYNIKMYNLNFTVESPNEIKRICKAYLCGENYRPEEFTRMHFYKGIF